MFNIPIKRDRYTKIASVCVKYTQYIGRDWKVVGKKREEGEKGLTKGTADDIIAELSWKSKGKIWTDSRRSLNRKKDFKKKIKNFCKTY